MLNSYEELQLLRNIVSPTESSLQMFPDSVSALPQTAVPDSETPVASSSSKESMATPPVEQGPTFLRHPRSAPLRTQASSPLNPASPPSPFARRLSAQFKRIPSEESRALSMIIPSSTNSTSRGSMILYRRVDPLDNVLFPPGAVRDSFVSTSGDSYVSLSSDSKYPAGLVATERGLIAYAYDPSTDDQVTPDEEDPLHDPEDKPVKSRTIVSGRGFRNMAMLLFLFACLLALFIGYPVVRFYQDDQRNVRIVGNARINSTGQADSVFFDPRSQIPLSPFSNEVRIGSDGQVYEVVFSDEFNVSGRSFDKGSDALWHVDNAPYDPRNIYTQDGYLVIKVNHTSTSPILRLRHPLCLNHGFVEISVLSTDGNASKRIYWSGTWTFADQDSGIVPTGSSLTETLSLDLHLGTAGRASPALREVMVDYVRVYQTKTQPAFSCEDPIPTQHIYAFLDALDHP